MRLQNGSTDTSIRAICGMSGIGKTTIAKFVDNQNSNSFDSSSFLANNREVSEQPNGLLCLQRQLLSDISKRKHGKRHNVDERLTKIKKSYRDSHEVLGKHRLIQDMGREIVHQESQEAGERSRTWHHGDAFRVLQNETVNKISSGRKTVEGHTLDMLMSKEAGNNAKKCHYEEFCAKSVLLKHASSLKRRCLSLLSGQSFLGSLKILDLSYCDWLTRTPNFLGLPNLKRLILKGCVSLVEVYESIGNLEMLDLLDLQYCNTLRKLLRNIGKGGSLRL
ncbi:hypothetical protein LguiA_008151 [Lonicera macranthoides]